MRPLGNLGPRRQTPSRGAEREDVMPKDDRKRLVVEIRSFGSAEGPKLGQAGLSPPGRLAQSIVGEL
jgi:hypothetical protein